MSAMTVFIRTLLKTSAIFIGTTVVFLHPPLDWTPARTITAQKSPAEAAIDALVLALHDSDAHVRRTAAASLGRLTPPQALPSLLSALDDPDPVVRQLAARGVRNIREAIRLQGARTR